MKEGWYRESYWQLCDNRAEQLELMKSYELEHYLQGYELVGLLDWNDFILVNSSQKYSRVPTCALKKDYLEDLEHNMNTIFELERQRDLEGLVLWYVKPLILGGDPKDDANKEWVTFQKHVELVKYWNKLLNS